MSVYEELNKLKSITHESIDLDDLVRNRKDELLKFKPIENKNVVLEYLKAHTKPWIIGMQHCADPITNEIYFSANWICKKDGFVWSIQEAYLFEKYNVRLSDEFLQMFD